MFQWRFLHSELEKSCLSVYVRVRFNGGFDFVRNSAHLVMWSSCCRRLGLMTSRV